MPEERVPEHIECAHKSCKSVFWRPQEADGDSVLATSLSTMDLAQLRGWTVIDRERGLAHCVWGHRE